MLPSKQRASNVHSSAGSTGCPHLSKGHRVLMFLHFPSTAAAGHSHQLSSHLLSTKGSHLCKAPSAQVSAIHHMLALKQTHKVLTHQQSSHKQEHRVHPRRQPQVLTHRQRAPACSGASREHHVMMHGQGTSGLTHYTTCLLPHDPASGIAAFLRLTASPTHILHGDGCRRGL